MGNQHLEASFLQIPDLYLTDEKDREIQRKFLETLNSKKIFKSSTFNPTQLEIYSTFELSLPFLVSKLAQNKFSYKILLDAIHNNKYEKVGRIICHNSWFFKEGQTIGNSNAVGVRKADDFKCSGEISIEKIPCRIMAEKMTHALEKERKTNERMGSSHNYQLVSINTTEVYLDTLKHDSNEMESKGENPCMDNQSNEKENGNIDMDRELEKIYATVNSSSINLPWTQPDKKKKQDDMKQFAQLMKEAAEKERKELKEFEDKLKKERDIWNKEFVKKQKEAEEIYDKLVKMQQVNEEKMRLESEESRRKFEEKMEGLRRKQEEFLRKIRQEREELELEYKRIEQENIATLYASIEMFSKCVNIQFQLEEKENEWGDFIKKLKNPVIQAKIQFAKFEDARQKFSKNNEIDKAIMETEVARLHHKVNIAHNLLYRAFFYLKDLSEKHEDRIFLKILQKEVQLLCDHLLIIEKNKNTMNRDTWDCLPDLFSSISPHSIPSTVQLKKLSKEARREDNEAIPDPIKPTQSEAAETEGQERTEPFVIVEEQETTETTKQVLESDEHINDPLSSSNDSESHPATEDDDSCFQQPPVHL